MRHESRHRFVLPQFDSVSQNAAVVNSQQRCDSIMTGIFPPTGEQDKHRARLLKSDERQYLLFCLEFCGQILERRPNHLEALELAANHYTEMGYFNDGLELDRRLAALRPNDPGVLYNLSCSLALTGSVQDALDCLSLAVAKGYRDYKHMSTDRDLAPLRSQPRFGELLAMVAREGA